MPLYEYECDACGKRFEVIQKFSDSHVEVCKECGRGPVRRLLSSPAIQFKGTGWYVTDYAQKGKSSTDASSTKSDSKTSDSGTTGDSAKSESSKSDSTPAPSASKPNASS